MSNFDDAIAEFNAMSDDDKRQARRELRSLLNAPDPNTGETVLDVWRSQSAGCDESAAAIDRLRRVNRFLEALSVRRDGMTFSEVLHHESMRDFRAVMLTWILSGLSDEGSIHIVFVGDRIESVHRIQPECGDD